MITHYPFLSGEFVVVLLLCLFLCILYPHVAITHEDVLSWRTTSATEPSTEPLGLATRWGG